MATSIRRVAVIAALVAALTTVGASHAKVPPAPAANPLPLAGWTTDQPVHALTIAQNHVYLGGNFTRIGPVTGGAVALDATSAAYDAHFPFVLGRVYAAIDDGAGGVYIGGKFNLVGGLPRANIARIRADGTVDPDFVPGLDGPVLSLARDGNRLYAGGDFVHANDLIRRRLAAFDATNGLIDHGFDPGVDGPVTDLALAPGRLFVAGLFLGISGNARTTLAAVDPATGDLDHSFDAAPDGPVIALAVIGDRLFAGGAFHTVNGRSRTNLAAFDVSTGDLVGTFSPSVNGRVEELATDGTRLFVGGRFTEIERSFNTSLASLDPVTGKASQEFRAFVDGDVRAIAFADGRLYVGGAFLKVDGLPIDRLAAVDAHTGAVDPAFKPDPDNDVVAVVAGGGRVYAGGTFTSAPRFPVPGLAALDASSGVWDPAFSAGVAHSAGEGGGVGDVTKLVAHDSRLYAAGRFELAGGQVRRNVAAFDLTTGGLEPFRADTNGTVSSLAIGNGRVFLGGSFDRVRGQFHNGLAAVDPASGKPVASFNPGSRKRPGPFQDVEAVVAGGGRLFVGGYVITGHKTVITGRRFKKKRRITLTSGLVSISPLRATIKHSFRSLVEGDVYTLALAANRVYVGGDVFRISGYRIRTVRRHGKPKKIRIPKYRNGLFALNPRSGALDKRFFPKAPPVNDLAVGSRGLYAAGGYRVSGGRNRRDGATLMSFTTGVPAPDFHPEPRTPANGFAALAAIATGGGHVAIGGDFHWIGPSYQPYVAILPVPGA
ncbi:MAG: trimeric autotransporter adhesin [Thermoleophilaceae bacterium]|nr:trimeric autotransporter adhesin [Thermoleophilaceae bacterium]